MLKALCQTEKIKTLAWWTNASLQCQGVPQQFTTTSRVLLIGNEWRTLNADVAALEDRGHMLVFEPAAQEVHRHAAEWFWDQEVFDFIADHLHLLMQPSLRLYVHAWELKGAGLEWRPAVLSRCVSGVALEVLKLKANPTFTSEAARVRAFVESGAGCRATYFQHAKKLKPAQERPQFKLRHTEPPAAPLDSYLDKLRQRFGDLGNG